MVTRVLAVVQMPQSSRLWRALPAWLVVLVSLSASLLGAQERYRLERTGNFRREADPNGVLLASVNAEVELVGAARRDQWVEVTLEGWVWERSLETAARDGYDLVVAARNGENLRAEPNGAILARLAYGCLLSELERRPGWIRVRRTGWIYAPTLRRVETAVAPASPAGPDTSLSDISRGSLDRAVVLERATLRRVPDGPPLGTLGEEAPVKILARSGEWVRVQTEGWVREAELKPSAPGVLVGVSGAEVRSQPGEFVGKLVQWTVQYIAVQQADELRPDIPPGQRYVLARGPLPEAGFVYLVVTDEQRQAIERLAPLTELVIVGRVRVARSRYLGNPVLQLVQWAVR